MNDFKKFATRHMGINSMVFEDVVKMQNQYLNPYILEERQLNVTQMDVFSRLMMDRIISSERKLTTIRQTHCRPNFCIWIRATQERTFPYILIHRAVRSMPVWVFTTQCNSSKATLQRFARAWLHPWPLFCLLREKKASALDWNTAVL